MQDVWSLLASHGVTIVLAGHEHNYQCWSAIDGVTQIVVGTGGGGPHELSGIPSDSRVVARATHIVGVLQLALEEHHALFRFVTIKHRVLDAGRLACSGAR